MRGRVIAGVAVVLVLLFAVTGSPFDGDVVRNGWIPAGDTQVRVARTPAAQAVLTAHVRWYHDHWPHSLRRGEVGRGTRLEAVRPVPCIWLRLRWRTWTRKTTAGSPDIVHCRKKGQRRPDPIRVRSAEARRLLSAVEFSVGAGPRRLVFASDANIRIRYP